MFLGTKEQTDDFEQRFAEELCQRFSGVRSQPVIYEAMPLGTTKATALSRLAAILKIEPSEIMAMGDANNDIEMLQFAGLGIAMGNASDHVKSLLLMTLQLATKKTALHAPLRSIFYN